MNEHQLQATRLLLRESYSDVHLTLELRDTTDPDFTQRVENGTIRCWQRLNYAVNYAGVLGPLASSHKVDFDEHDRIMNVIKWYLSVQPDGAGRNVAERNTCYQW